jgi:16S rRNA (cytosine967-C5)-methyltransferase
MKNARDLALNILYRVFEQGEYASLLLQEELHLVEEIDQAFVTALVYSTLQHQIFLRAQWSDFAVRKPRTKLAILLDMACAQFFLMDKIPAYAVVNESVELAKQFVSIQEVKWVNVVLRKAMERGRLDFDESNLDAISKKLSIPEWILAMWQKQYGQDLGITIAKSLLEPAFLYARVNTLKIDETIITQHPEVQSGSLCKSALKAQFNWLNTSWFVEGKIWIQDQASQYVSEQLDVQEGHKVLDVCSAPGTKAALNQIKVNNQATFDMIDIHPHRIQLIENQIERLDLKNMRLYTMDARHLQDHFKDKSYDRIMVDAPCSGLGVIRRKAEIKYRLKPSDIDELVILQAQILDASAPLLKIQGVLLYATCTLNKKENEKQIQNFLSRHPEYQLLDEKTLFPHEFQSDGFYYAKLKRMK